ncbi:VCBS repeat-containing protein [Streptomyces sp. NBC_00572]|uniref:FG-GAP repeat domain-containing protein n=1 Tax=Streptomyces sp. NBC_00572 TaxID=2903664 RepID=UPI00224C994D|nr:VCBS repeat-containing protein [Streptomyces sp. NBC_00572]MCX4981363.1 VCBS repeat-containing protein [Streptomyces sp. NBC_00572]
MNYARTRGRRLAAAAVTIVLAATGGTLTALPATAAPVSGAAQEDQQTIAPYPKGDVDVLGGGSAGFFTHTPRTRTVSWTRYADGVTTPVIDGLHTGTGAYAVASDVLVRGDHANQLLASRVLTVRDLASGAEPYVVDLAALEKDGATYSYRGVVGGTLVVAVRKADGTVEGRLLVPGPGGPQQRVITGLPADQAGFTVVQQGGTMSGSALLYVSAGPVDARRSTRAVLDLASATVTDAVPVPASLDHRQSGALSASHVAWGDPEDLLHLAVGLRGSDSMRRTTVPTYYRYGLVGDWLVFGAPGEGWSPLQAERADGSGGRVQILDRVESLAPGPDGSLLARGGTIAHGEGLYRVTAGAEGAPVAELVATTGEPSVLVYGGADIPATIDFDRLDGVDLRWRLSRQNAYANVTITRRTGTGRVESVERRGLKAMGDDAVGFHWNGEDLVTPGRPAPAGTYTWTFEAKPRDGVGEPVRGSGTFTVRRTPGLHDYDGNGAPELFALERNGGPFKSVDIVPGTPGTPPALREKTVIAGYAYDRIESSGDLAGSPLADLVARDGSGVLWLHRGSGDRQRPLLDRVRVGGGWNTYDHLAGGSDVTGDGRADLVATDRAGVLWAYPGTGDATSPFGARKRVGGGWGIYNDVTATGNLAGGPAGDLLARDRAGVLWLYLGKGDGTFAPRTRVGGGWDGFEELVAIGDVNSDGRQDLLARTGALVSYYLGSGDWKAPFRAGPRRESTTLGTDRVF